jgi:hypothetical protein
MAVGRRFAALGIVFLVMPATAKAACQVSDLSWMTGRWNFQRGDHSGQETWKFSEFGLIELATASGAPSSGGVVKLSTISPEQGMLVLRMRFFDGSLQHALEDKDAPVVFSASACGPGFIQFDGKYGEYTRYERSGDNMINSGIANNNGKPGQYRVLLVREK